MSVMLVKGHSSSISLLHICSCIVFLSSLSQLTCPVLRIDLRFSYFFFSSRCMIFMCTKERERERLCVCMSAVDYLHNYICSFLGAMCSYSFYRWKNEKEKRCKKTYRIFVDFLFLFSSFFLKYASLSSILIGTKKHIGIGTQGCDIDIRPSRLLRIKKE
jgi:hypothetical protein